MARIVPVSLVALGFLAAGCGGNTHNAAPPPSPAPVTAGALAQRVGPVDPTQSPAPTPATVPLRVVKRNGQTLALAPVTVHGKPYLFVVDTGATATLVTSSAAKEMGLRPTGAQAPARGVAGATTVKLMQISDWSLGNSKLPTSQVSSGDVTLGPDLAGLLGSDVLSTFQKVTIDYSHGTATLG